MYRVTIWALDHWTEGPDARTLVWEELVNNTDELIDVVTDYSFRMTPESHEVIVLPLAFQDRAVA